MSDTDNHTIRLLQEMRTELSGRFDGIEDRMQTIEAKVDGLTHILTLMAGHAHDLEERVSKLEKS